MKQNKKKLLDEHNDLGYSFELASTDKIYVTGLILHEIKDEFLVDFKGDFELDGSMITGPVERKTTIRFKNGDYFDIYIKAKEIDYVSEDITFTGYLYKLITPQFKVVKRNGFSKGTNYMEEIVEYRGRNCSIPTFRVCF